jgi:hypothetical protein
MTKRKMELEAYQELGELIAEAYDTFGDVITGIEEAHGESSSLARHAEQAQNGIRLLRRELGKHAVAEYPRNVELMNLYGPKPA